MQDRKKLFGFINIIARSYNRLVEQFVLFRKLLREVVALRRVVVIQVAGTSVVYSVFSGTTRRY